MAKVLQSSGPISMSQIADGFVDAPGNNRLNEYGGGDSGLTSQTKAAGTQRKFSDYYSREYKVVKELTNPDSQLPRGGVNDYYDLQGLFSQAELDAANQKVVNVRDPGVPIGLPPMGSPIDSAEFGVLRMYLSTFNAQGAITINNYAKIWAPGGIQQDYGDSLDAFSRNGGNAIAVETPVAGYGSYNLVINNYGELRGGGGAGAPGGKGGNGQYASNGVLTESVGGNGGFGSSGRGYQTTSPYFNSSISGGVGAAGTNNAGQGGTGGNGGDWGNPGVGGSTGTDGVLGGTQSLQNLGTITYSIGAGGLGGVGGAGYGGADGGTTTLTIGNTTFTAGGGGGAANRTGGAGSGSNYQTSVTSSGTPTFVSSEITTWYGGNGHSSDFGGGGGGALGTQYAGSNNGAMASLGDVNTIRGSLGAILATKLANDSTYGSAGINGSSYGQSGGSSDINGTRLDGGSPSRWGGGGGGGGYGGANGGNGNLGGGGGGAAGANDTGTTALWWTTGSYGERTLTDALARTGAHYISVMVRQGYPWGDSFEINEGLDVAYSLNNGSTWTSMAYIAGIDYNYWHTALYKVPVAARGTGVRFRISQRSRSSSNQDQWAVGPGKIHYLDGSVDVLWTPASIPGTFWYVTGTQDIDYTIARSNRAPGAQPGQYYVGSSIRSFEHNGGAGGSGFIVLGFYKASLPEATRYTYQVITSGTGSLDYTNTTDWDAVYVWVVGGGGGGGGADASISSEGGGGGAGTVIFAEYNKVSGSLNVNTTAAAGSSSFGAPGKAVAFQQGRKPTFTLNNSGIINGSYT